MYVNVELGLGFRDGPPCSMGEGGSRNLDYLVTFSVLGTIGRVARGPVNNPRSYPPKMREPVSVDSVNRMYLVGKRF